MTTETKNYDHLDIGLTLQRLEPGVAPVPIEMSLASLAVSMCRIANNLDIIQNAVHSNRGMASKMDDIRYAINNVSNNGQSATNAAHATNAAITNVGNILGDMLHHVQQIASNPTR